MRNSNDIYIRPSYEARVTELNTKHEDGVMDSDDDELLGKVVSLSGTEKQQETISSPPVRSSSITQRNEAMLSLSSSSFSSSESSFKSPANRTTLPSSFRIANTPLVANKEQEFSTPVSMKKRTVNMNSLGSQLPLLSPIQCNLPTLPIKTYKISLSSIEDQTENSESKTIRELREEMNTVLDAGNQSETLTHDSVPTKDQRLTNLSLISSLETDSYKSSSIIPFTPEPGTPKEENQELMNETMLVNKEISEYIERLKTMNEEKRFSLSQAVGDIHSMG